MLSRTSRILLVVALLAAGAYLLVERPRERAHDRNEATNDRLASFDAAAIDSIAIERPHENTLVFERADSLWHMAAPFPDSAEPGAIGTLLHALSTADINRNLGAESDLAPYGLDHPDAIITLSAAHHVVLQVTVGKNTVDDAWCYARIASGDVLLVPTDVHQSSTLPADEYRNHKVLDFQVRDVTAYTVHTSARSMSWTRRGTRWYALAGRDSVAGDSVAVLSPLHRLRGLRAAHIYPLDPVPQPAADSVRTMTVWMGPAHPNEITFAHLASGWMVFAPTRQMAVSDDLSDLFAHTTTELRDRRLLQFDPAVAEHIAFTTPSAGGEMVRAGGHWSFPNPALGRVNAEHAADFVRALRALKWAQPGGEAARTGAHQLYHIEISGAGGKLIDQLTAGPYDATMVWVSSLSSRGSWLIARSTLDDIASRFARVKER